MFLQLTGFVLSSSLLERKDLWDSAFLLHNFSLDWLLNFGRFVALQKRILVHQYASNIFAYKIQGKNLQYALTFRKWNACFLYIESDRWIFTTFGCLMLEKMIYSLTCSSVVLFVQKHGLVLLCDHWFAYFMLHICNFFLIKRKRTFGFDVHS
jgi:hypothetical protein